MKLSDYMNPEKFPLTSQKGLSAEKQFMLDAYNLDQIKQHLGQGGTLTDDQQALLKELTDKAEARPELMPEVTAETARRKAEQKASSQPSQEPVRPETNTGG